MRDCLEEIIQDAVKSTELLSGSLLRQIEKDVRQMRQDVREKVVLLEMQEVIESSIGLRRFFLRISGRCNKYFGKVHEKVAASPTGNITTEVCSDVYVLCNKLKEEWEKNVQVIHQQLFTSVSEYTQDGVLRNKQLESVVYYCYFLPDPEKYILLLQNCCREQANPEDILNILQELYEYLRDSLLETTKLQQDMYQAILQITAAYGNA